MITILYIWGFRFYCFRRAKYMIREMLISCRRRKGIALTALTSQVLQPTRMFEWSW